VGKVKFLRNREFSSRSKIINAMVTRDRCGDMWVSILVEDGSSPVPKAKVSEEGAVGIDMGLKNLAILSDDLRESEVHGKTPGEDKGHPAGLLTDGEEIEAPRCPEMEAAKLYRKLRDCREDLQVCFSEKLRDNSRNMHTFTNNMTLTDFTTNRSHHEKSIPHCCLHAAAFGGRHFFCAQSTSQCIILGK
jgi:hypothetical protein